MDTYFDAVIMGAGPAGSSAAILLARSGWRVALVEKQVFPRRKVCGECIAASNFPLLDAMGIGRDFFRLAGPALRRVALMSGNQTICADLPRFVDCPYQWGVALGREHLDTLLAAQAQHCGVQVFQPWFACATEGEPGAFRCHLRAVRTADRLTLTSPVLIDGRGSWEQVARTRQRRPSDLFAFKANFIHAKLEHGLLPVLSIPGGYGGMVIGDHGVATLAFCMRRDRLAACRKAMPAGSAAEAAAAHVEEHCAGVQSMLAGALRHRAWLAAGPIHPGIRIDRDAGGAFLIGNAAGEAHPIIGEGISMAIQSASLLAHLLAPCRSQVHDAQLQRRLQRGYATAWRRHFSARIRIAAVFAHAAMHPAACAWMLPLLKRYPALLGHFAHWSGKVRAEPQLEIGLGATARRLLDINDDRV